MHLCLHRNSGEKHTYLLASGWYVAHNFKSSIFVVYNRCCFIINLNRLHENAKSSQTWCSLKKDSKQFRLMYDSSKCFIPLFSPPFVMDLGTSFR